MLWQVDESIFNGQDYKPYAWSKTNDNIEFIHRSQHQTRHSVMAGISNDGLMLYQTKEQYYMSQEDVISFLRTLLRRNAGRRVCVYWDNASVHNAARVQAFIDDERNLLSTINTVPY